MATYKSLNDERHENIHGLLCILYYEWLALYSGQASKGVGYIWRYYGFFAGISLSSYGHVHIEKSNGTIFVITLLLPLHLRICCKYELLISKGQAWDRCS